MEFRQLRVGERRRETSPDERISWRSASRGRRRYRVVGHRGEVLMPSGGEALEAYAVRSASPVLAALAKRMPSMAHRKRDGRVEDVVRAALPPRSLTDD